MKLKLAKRKAVEIASKRDGCPEFPYFGAWYPDATCIDGELWDLDSFEDGQLVSSGDNPNCPFCHPELFIQEQWECEANLEESLDWMEKTIQKYGKWIKSDVNTH